MMLVEVAKSEVDQGLPVLRRQKGKCVKQGMHMRCAVSASDLQGKMSIMLQNVLSNSRRALWAI